jgi:plasmid stabilization system protein ParE
VLPVVWHPDAERDLLEIVSFVAHPNYLVFYRVLADRVQVEMVAHARQQYP